MQTAYKLEVASLDEKRKLRVELRELRAKQFTVSQKPSAISKSEERKFTSQIANEVNNNVSTSPAVKQEESSPNIHKQSASTKKSTISINIRNPNSSLKSVPTEGNAVSLSIPSSAINNVDREDRKVCETPYNSNKVNNINNITENKVETNGEKMSVTLRTRAITTKDNNNNVTGKDAEVQGLRAVSAEERAARRAKRMQRQTNPEEVKNVTNALNTVTINTSSNAKTDGSGLRRTNTWSPQKSSNSVAAAKAKFGGETSKSPLTFGVSYVKTNNESEKPAAPKASTGRVATNRFSQIESRPTVKVTQPESRAGTGRQNFSAKPTSKGREINQRPKSAAYATSRTGAGSTTPSRFPGVAKNEPEPPSFDTKQTGSATDRMAYFREAMQKEKEAEEKKKKREEERKKREVEAEQERKRKEAEVLEEEKRKKEEDARKKEEEENEIPDSEKIKTQHVARCKKREKKPARRTMSISNIVMDWVQEMVKDYEQYGVEVRNFSSSWNDGMAFCALIHRFNPDEFDFSELRPENKRYNFDLAFDTGEKVKKIPKLLDTEDMVRMKKPEPRSVQTYIQWIWSVYGPTSGYGPTPQEVQNATVA